MMPISNRRQPATRTGRPIPNLPPTYHSKIEKPKTAVNELYHLDETDGKKSALVPTALNQAYKRLDQCAPSCSHLSVPPRSQSARPTINSISFPVMSSKSLSPSTSSNNKRAPTPPPPYVENVGSQENTDINAATAPNRSRSRNSSASSWIKRVVSRSSSRADIRKQYEEIPMTEEERAAAEELRARKAERALAEWNRINDALKNAGF